MSRVVVNARGSYRVGSGEPWWTQSLVLVPLVDEWTGRPPSQVTVRTFAPRTSAHVTGGHVVVTGIPELALPTLGTAPQVIRVRLSRAGRPAQDAEVVVPMGAALPFTAPALAVDGPVVALAGTVERALFPYTAIGNATVAVSGPAAAPLVAVSPPLAVAHLAGTTIRERTLTDGATTSLAQACASGEVALKLASTAGVVPGSILRIGLDMVVVASVLTPGVVDLRTPVTAGVAAGAVVTRMTLGATGASTTLRRAARPGDGVLPCAAPLPGTHVEVVDGSDTEYRSTQVVTDGVDGSWRLAGVRGIPDVTLTTSATGFTTLTRTHPLSPTADPVVVTTALRP